MLYRKQEAIDSRGFHCLTGKDRPRPKCDGKSCAENARWMRHRYFLPDVHVEQDDCCLLLSRIRIDPGILTVDGHLNDGRTITIRYREALNKIVPEVLCECGNWLAPQQHDKLAKPARKKKAPTKEPDSTKPTTGKRNNNREDRLQSSQVIASDMSFIAASRGDSWYYELQILATKKVPRKALVFVRLLDEQGNPLLLNSADPVSGCGLAAQVVTFASYAPNNISPEERRIIAAHAGQELLEARVRWPIPADLRGVHSCRIVVHPLVVSYYEATPGCSEFLLHPGGPYVAHRGKVSAGLSTASELKSWGHLLSQTDRVHLKLDVDDLCRSPAFQASTYAKDYRKYGGAAFEASVEAIDAGLDCALLGYSPDQKAAYIRGVIAQTKEQEQLMEFKSALRHKSYDDPNTESEIGATEVKRKKRRWVNDLLGLQDVHTLEDIRSYIQGAILSSIPEEWHREALFLRIDGWSVPDIADKLGRPPNTVHQAISRARRSLREAIS